MKAARWIPLLVVIGSVLPGCQKPAEEAIPLLAETDYSAPLPPGQIALRKITDPDRIPDFRPAFQLRTNLDTAVARSLNYLSKPSSRNYFPYDPQGEITHDRAVASLELFRRTLAEANSPDHLDALIRSRFEVWESVGCDGRGTVLFTGYYCPIFDARLQPDAEFRYPLYRAPGDLLKDSEGNCKGRRLPGGGIDPTYYDRREIVTGGVLAGYELCYLRDPFEAYIVTVQGSAKLRLPDGSLFEIGYTANNGHDYVSVGRLLVADGKISADELSLATLIDYFKQHPRECSRYTDRNPRYVFFQQHAGGPFGSLNEPVTPYRSIATDKDVYPRACIAFVQTRLPGYEGRRIVEHAYHAFALDQDTGGAVRAAGRCDVFLGTGDAVGQLAGRTLAEGRIYYLFTR
ncbi:MAG TPA: MltA domain-containing protein [Phycisphaerae bacterium]|nr:MltA domain-containing protein [Phycisphaerae bacterium]